MITHDPPTATTCTAEPMLTVDELASLWRVHPDTIRKWIAAGVLPAVRFGPRVTRVSQSVAVEFSCHQIRWTVTSDRDDDGQ